MPHFVFPHLEVEPNTLPAAVRLEFPTIATPIDVDEVRILEQASKTQLVHFLREVELLENIVFVVANITLNIPRLNVVIALDTENVRTIDLHHDSGPPMPMQKKRTYVAYTTAYSLLVDRLALPTTRGSGRTRPNNPHLSLQKVDDAGGDEQTRNDRDGPNRAESLDGFHLMGSYYPCKKKSKV
jgi:hypothetical protein